MMESIHLSHCCPQDNLISLDMNFIEFVAKAKYKLFVIYWEQFDIEAKYELKDIVFFFFFNHCMLNKKAAYPKG